MLLLGTILVCFCVLTCCLFVSQEYNPASVHFCHLILDVQHLDMGLVPFVEGPQGSESTVHGGEFSVS